MKLFSVDVGVPATRRVVMGGLVSVMLVSLTFCTGKDKDDPELLSTFCETFCTRVTECDSAVDTVTCNSSCNSANSVVFPKLRDEMVTGTSNCLVGDPCSTYASGQAVCACAETAAASLSPSTDGEAFCTDYQAAALACDNPIDLAECQGLVKRFTDSTLATAMACLTNTCSDLISCVTAALQYSGNFSECGFPYSASLSKRRHKSSFALHRKELAVPRLSASSVVSVRFSWKRGSGRKHPYDLALGLQGRERPLFQVFERAGRPYARVGMAVAPIQQGKAYELRVTLDPAGAKTASVAVLTEVATQRSVLSARADGASVQSVWYERPRVGKRPDSRVLVSGFRVDRNLSVSSGTASRAISQAATRSTDG